MVFEGDAQDPAPILIALARVLRILRGLTFVPCLFALGSVAIIPRLIGVIIRWRLGRERIVAGRLVRLGLSGLTRLRRLVGARLGRRPRVRLFDLRLGLARRIRGLRVRFLSPGQGGSEEQAPRNARRLPKLCRVHQFSSKLSEGETERPLW
jgi:hypothetical protein